MDQFIDWVCTSTGCTEATAARVVYSIITVVLLWALRFLILRIAWRRTDDVRTRYTWRKVTGYISVIVGVLILGRIWLAGFQTFMTFAGLVSAGVAIALRDTLANIAGWAFIMWRRPFVLGDRVQIGDISGDVIDIRMFQFSLLEVKGWVDADQSTGRVLHVPNGMVMTTPLANYSAGFEYIWNEIPVLITFESDWRKAKKFLREIADERAESLSEKAAARLRESSKRFMIFYQTFTPAVYTSVKDSGVMLTLRYLCHPRQRRGSTEMIWEDILDRFGADPDIDFAYPTRRFYTSSGERKDLGGRERPAPGPEGQDDREGTR